jgi:S-adenosylmethionine synthetase
VLVECFNTETIPVERIESLVSEHFDLRPAAILRDLDLRRPIYRRPPRTGTSADGADFTWEGSTKPTPCASRQARRLGDGLRR